MSTSRATWRRRSRSSSALLFLALVVAGCGAAKPASNDDADRAELVFTRYDANGEHPSVWVADADGSNARLFAADASDGLLSPDGRRVAYWVVEGPDDDWGTIYVRAIGGGKPRRIGDAIWFRWSPQSNYLALFAAQTLTIVDVNSNKRTMLRQGGVVYWGALSFAPDGSAVAYGRADDRDGHVGESDIFVSSLPSGKTERLTSDGYSDQPVWGPDWIAFRHFRFVSDDRLTSIGELRFMRPDGSSDHLFARDEGERLSMPYGLEPVEFSTDGKRLLACSAHEFTCPPVTFTVPDGKRYEPSLEDTPLTGIDLSPDGDEILVGSGAAEGPYDIYAMPFTGGPAHLLAKNASFANWADE